MFLDKLKLVPKLNFLLVIVFITGFSCSGFALSQVLQNQAQAEVTSKAQALVQTMNSVRDYTSNNIQPLLSSRLETEPRFIAETVPAFAATEVFQILRKEDTYKNYLYKEATLNPTNLRDKADSFEASLVKQFRENRSLPNLSGFRDLPGGRVFFIAKPLAVTKESCLRCHSTPDLAPKSQIATYGSENGFGWQLNEVVAAQMISVPAEEVLKSAERSLALMLLILSGIFAIVLMLINYLLKRSVVRPIQRIALTAEAVSLGDLEAEFDQRTQDEIGALAAAFNRMKASLVIAMNMLNKRE